MTKKKKIPVPEIGTTCPALANENYEYHLNEGHHTPLLSWLPTANGAMKAASIVGIAPNTFLEEVK